MQNNLTNRMENTDAVLDSSLCTACLCVGRKLRKITNVKQRQYYMDILKEIPLTSVRVRVPSICWECSVTLSNAISFREQVQTSYRILQTYEENLHNSILTEISRPPRLKIMKNEPIDIISEVPLAMDCNVKEEMKTEHGLNSEASDRKQEEPLLLKKNKQKIHQVSWVRSKRIKFNINGRKEISGSDKSELADINNDSIDNAILNEEFDDETYSNKECDSNVNSLMLNGDAPLVHLKKIRKHKISLKLPETNRSLKVNKNKKGKNPASAAYCAECDISFKSVSSLRRHMRNSLKHVSRDQLRFTCDDCKKRFADKTRLRDHIEEKHLHKSYKCQICHKPFKNRVGLDQHIRNVHKGRPNNKICHYCGKAFPNSTKLRFHITALHTRECPYKCKLCSARFGWHSCLWRHLRRVHKSEYVT